MDIENDNEDQEGEENNGMELENWLQYKWNYYFKLWVIYLFKIYR